MMKERLQQKLEEAVAGLLRSTGAETAVPEVALEVPRNPEHGDFASNAALVLARPLKRPPRAIATELAERLRGETELLEDIEIAGPGFLNFRLRRDRWHGVLKQILLEGPGFASVPAEVPERVQVEFVSANPTGPLTLGHGRQAVLGDSIARLLAARGHEVTREYYFNDGGRQMRVLGESVKARYLELLGRAAPPPPECLEEGGAWPGEIDGLPVIFPRDGYQGDYVREIAEALVAEYGEDLVDEAPDGRFRQVAQERIFSEIRATLEALDIRFDVYFNESDLYREGKNDEVLAELCERGLVYEKDGAVWLRSTELGLPRDRVLVKRTGEPTYLLPDIAYHREKFRRGFERIIDVQGADHKEQFPYVVAAVGALGFDASRIELVMHQFVTLTRGGQQVKQSTRRATYVTVDELLSRVGRDVFRFFMVQRKADGHLDFDLDLAEETDWKKNPAYYVQYAHARACSIERRAREAGLGLPDAGSFDASPLRLPEETQLLRKLAEFPDLVRRAADSREPHHVAYYLRELAGQWNPYVQDGRRHRILSDDRPLSLARLGLAVAVRTVLASGLALIGLSAPERM